MNRMHKQFLTASGVFASFVCSVALGVNGGGGATLSQGAAALDTGDEALSTTADDGSAPIIVDDGDLFPPVDIDPSVFDMDDDGVVNAYDFVQTILALGASGGPFDFNNDGIVDSADLGLMLAAYGMHVASQADAEREPARRESAPSTDNQASRRAG